MLFIILPKPEILLRKAARNSKKTSWTVKTANFLDLPTRNVDNIHMVYGTLAA